LIVASAIIRQRAVLIEGPRGHLPLPAITFNLNYVFEAYLRNLLRAHAAGSSWEVTVQDGNDEGKRAYFATAPSTQATPDIVIVSPDGKPSLVIEVKNVPIGEGLSKRDHVNQALAYGLVYDTAGVLLVHPLKGPSHSTGVRVLGAVGRKAQVTIRQYRFDLGADDLIAEEQRFCTAVAGLSSAA